VPNIIVELTQEKARVKALLWQFDYVVRAQAERALKFADQYMAMNDLEGMKDSLEELRLFTKGQKK